VIVETGKKSRTEFIGNVCVKLCGTVMVTEIRKGEKNVNFNERKNIR
tara:strand:+ start:204 stop:344 length:141 start_codon:yes stop_codon:yes gene_type:complete